MIFIRYSEDKGLEEKKLISKLREAIHCKGALEVPLGFQRIARLCQIDEMLMGHAAFCYNAIEKRKPNSVYDICKNSKQKWGYLEKGNEPYSFKITIQGENLVKPYLPRKSKK